MDHQVYTLPNGIRLLHKPFPSEVSHACIVIGAGSRDEEPGKAGLAHFIEHLLFKRTERRSTNQILNRLELVGADLNAYTTKEYTCIHASFLRPHLERALDLFEDLVFHSVFPDDELEKEKGVILDEIASYQDQPEDAIQDDFEDLLFEGHPLGNNILGQPESVQSFQREHLLDFLDAHYGNNQVVIGVLGNYPFDKLCKLANKLFGSLPDHAVSPARSAPSVLPPVHRQQTKAISQSHAVIGSRAYSLYHPHKMALLLLNNVLGGTGMSSRLNLQIREKYGIAYTIESSYVPFTDTGMFTVYFGTDPEKTDRAFSLLHKELKKLRDTGLGTLLLRQAKEKFIGQIALGEENRMGMIIAMAKNLLDHDRAETLDEIVGKVQAVTSAQLLEVANEVFDPSQFSTLLFSPEK